MGAEDPWQMRVKRKEERSGEKGLTSGSGSLSKMGRAADESSLCLDWKERDRRNWRVGRKIVKKFYQKKRGKKKKEGITYPPFIGRYGVRSSFPFATTSPASQQNTCRRQWCGRLGSASRLGLGSRLRFGRRLFARNRKINYFNFFLLTRGIVASMPKPPFLLCVPLENG